MMNFEETLIASLPLFFFLFIMIVLHENR